MVFCSGSGENLYLHFRLHVEASLSSFTLVMSVFPRRRCLSKEPKALEMKFTVAKLDEVA